MLTAARVPKLAGRWLRLLLLLGGDIEPHPGPRQPLRVPRGPLDLQSGFTAGAVQRMARCMQAFKEWVMMSELGFPFSRLCRCSAEPGESRPVMSSPIVEAMVAVAQWLLLGSVACALLIGFLRMLHPSEYLALTRGDLILPADALSSDRIAYVHVRNPKTARFARRQHCRLEDVSVLRLLESLFGSLHFDSRIFRALKPPFEVSGMPL